MNPNDPDGGTVDHTPDPESASDAGPYDVSLAATLEEFLGLVKTGRRPSREEFLARQGSDAGDLAACIDGLELILSAAPQLPGPPGDSGSDGLGLDSGIPRDGDESAAPLAPSTRLGDFRIAREVGRGGMGVVYEAEQLSLGRRVALKVLPFAASLDPRQRQRFQLEAQAAAHLHHKHIVPVFAVGRDRGVHYYAMQFIEGRSLAAVVRDVRRGGTGLLDPAATSPHPAIPTPDSPTGPHAVRSESEAARTASSAVGPRDRSYVRAVARLGVQAALALEHAHALGVIHRDVKPGNLLLDPHGDLWVTDFGLARFLDDPGVTRTGDLLGTLAYMSPEQAMGRREVDHRADLYSLGATLYEMLVLRPPFDGRDRQELLRKIANDEPTRPRKLDPSIPQDLETVLLKAMAKEPSARYATAKDLADELDRFLHGQPIRARRPGPVEHVSKWAMRHRAVVVTAATVLILAMAVGTALMWGEKRRTDDARRALRESLLLTFEHADRMTMNEMQRLTFDAGVSGKKLSPAALDASRARAQDFYEMVARQEPYDPGMRALIARARHRAGFTRMLRGVAGADDAFRASVADYERLIVEQPGERSHRLRLIETLNEWAMMSANGGGIDAAVPLYRKAFGLTRETVLSTAVDPHELSRIASYQISFAGQLEAAGRAGEARAAWLGLTALYADLARLPSSTPDRRRSLAASHTVSGFEVTSGRDSPGSRLQAEKFYRLALLLDPENPTTNNDLAWLLADRPDQAPHDPRRAVAFAAKAVEANPGHAAFWNTLGVARYRAGDYQAARDAFMKSVALHPSPGGDPNDWYFLAMIEYKTGDPIKARAWFDRASDWMARKTTPTDPDMPRFHNEASALMGLPVLDAISPQVVGTGAST